MTPPNPSALPTHPRAAGRPDAPAPLTALAVAATGALSLAALMGIGRFAFTPVLPMMLSDGTLSLTGASALASLNYLGYLVGALACALGLMPWLQRALAQRLPSGRAPSPEVALLAAMLLATALLTAAMALPWAAGWPVWRLASGVVSAIGFVLTTQWCLTQLARRDRTALGGLIYTGPGAGIAVGGLAAGGMVAGGWTASAAWGAFGLLALGLAAVAWRTLRRDGATSSLPRPSVPSVQSLPPTPPVPAAHGPAPEGGPVRALQAATASAQQGGLTPTSGEPTGSGPVAMSALTFAYGLAGLGYIIPATFMPVMARAWLGTDATGGGASLLVDLFWPLFGVGVVIGALVATRVRESVDLCGALAVCYLIQAAGVALAAGWPRTTGLALGCLLLGLPFTAMTFFAMREVRRLRPLTATRWIGLTTAAYGVGQIAGPPLAAALVALSGDAGAGFRLSMHLATAALLTGAAVFGALMLFRPRP